MMERKKRSILLDGIHIADLVGLPPTTQKLLVGEMHIQTVGQLVDQVDRSHGHLSEVIIKGKPITKTHVNAIESALMNSPQIPDWWKLQWEWTPLPAPSTARVVTPPAPPEVVVPEAPPTAKVTPVVKEPAVVVKPKKKGFLDGLLR